MYLQHNQFSPQHIYPFYLKIHSKISSFHIHCDLLHFHLQKNAIQLLKRWIFFILVYEILPLFCKILNVIDYFAGNVSWAFLLYFLFYFDCFIVEVVEKMLEKWWEKYLDVWSYALDYFHSCFHQQFKILITSKDFTILPAYNIICINALNRNIVMDVLINWIFKIYHYFHINKSSKACSIFFATPNQICCVHFPTKPSL